MLIDNKIKKCRGTHPTTIESECRYVDMIRDVIDLFVQFRSIGGYGCGFVTEMEIF